NCGSETQKFPTLAIRAFGVTELADGAVLMLAAVLSRSGQPLRVSLPRVVGDDFAWNDKVVRPAGRPIEIDKHVEVIFGKKGFRPTGDYPHRFGTLVGFDLNRD